MGTRSLTTVIEKGTWNGKNYKNKLITMYRQYDGYLDGMGRELADFLKGGDLVNGFTPGAKGVEFNGAGCLAAQIVAHFKTGVGGFYLHKPGTINCGEEWRYEVIVDNSSDKIILKCMEVGYMNKKNKYVNRTKTWFNDEAKYFDTWLKEYMEARKRDN